VARPGRCSGSLKGNQDHFLGGAGSEDLSRKTPSCHQKWTFAAVKRTLQSYRNPELYRRIWPPSSQIPATPDMQSAYRRISHLVHSKGIPFLDTRRLVASLPKWAFVFCQVHISWAVLVACLLLDVFKFAIPPSTRVLSLGEPREAYCTTQDRLPSGYPECAYIIAYNYFIVNSAN